MQVATKSKNAQRLSWETQWKFILTSFKHHNLLSGLRIRRTCVLEVFDWPYIFRYGGIYLDDTQIVTRSMDPLRKLSCSMPYEKKGTLMNGVIVAEPNAAFLKKWFFLGYQDFEVSNPIYFSPYRLLPFFFYIDKITASITENCVTKSIMSTCLKWLEHRNSTMS